MKFRIIQINSVHVFVELQRSLQVFDQASFLHTTTVKIIKYGTLSFVPKLLWRKTNA